MKQTMCVLVVACVLVGGSAARSELHCDQPAVQTDEVRSGTPLVHRFALVNTGAEAVEILDVKPSCGCLTPRIDKRIYAPGDRGQLQLEVNTLTQAEGRQSWRVAVRYRSGQEEHELVLVMAATIIREVSVTPPSLVLTTSGPISHEITLTDRRQTPLEVSTVLTSSPHLRAKLGDWKKDDDGHFVRGITLDVLADCPEGKRDEVLQIFTSDPDYRELRIPVTIVKKAKRTVSASPDAVFEVSSANEAAPSRTIMLRDTGDQEIIVDHVECSTAAIVCQATKGPGHRATITVRLDRKLVMGDSVEGTVRVMLQQPAGQVVTIPVSWSLK